jgi:hypothetical protein
MFRRLLHHFHGEQCVTCSIVTDIARNDVGYVLVDSELSWTVLGNVRSEKRNRSTGKRFNIASRMGLLDGLLNGINCT